MRIQNKTNEHCHLQGDQSQLKQHILLIAFLFKFYFSNLSLHFLWYICNFECCNHKMFTCLKFLLILLFISIIKILEKEMLQQKKEINKNITQK